jgi:hypothetical protein
MSSKEIINPNDAFTLKAIDDAISTAQAMQKDDERRSKTYGNISPTNLVNIINCLHLCKTYATDQTR